jgi:hypothetical protein
VPFPETVLIRSWSALSLRACWRLFRADAILFGAMGQLRRDESKERQAEGARGRHVGSKAGRGANRL